MQANKLRHKVGFTRGVQLCHYRNIKNYLSKSLINTLLYSARLFCENLTILGNYSDERVLCSAPQTCLANCMYKKQSLRKILIIGALRTWVDSRVSLLIIEVKINFSLGFDNTDYHTNKLSNVHALHCTIVLYIVP